MDGMHRMDLICIGHWQAHAASAGRPCFIALAKHVWLSWFAAVFVVFDDKNTVPDASGSLMLGLIHFVLTDSA